MADIQWTDHGDGDGATGVGPGVRYEVVRGGRVWWQPFFLEIRHAGGIIVLRDAFCALRDAKDWAERYAAGAVELPDDVITSR